MFDLIAVGESLIDIIVSSPNENNSMFLEGNPGGAPANVMAGGSKLGLKTAIITKVGNDCFGELLIKTFKQANINTDYVSISKEHPTTLAMVSLDESGNRSFTFYRDRTADVMLTQQEVSTKAIENCKVFHFGSVSMTSEPACGATFFAAKKASELGKIVSYDPNLRALLWDNLDTAKQKIKQGFEFADVVKLSDEELEFLTDQKELKLGMELLLDQYNIKLLIVTRGPKGAVALTSNKVFATSETFDVKVVDTTGAGDSFWSAVLYTILKNNIDISQITQLQLDNMLKFSNAAGSFSTTTKGAIKSLATIEDIENLMKKFE